MPAAKTIQSFIALFGPIQKVTHIETFFPSDRLLKILRNTEISTPRFYINSDNRTLSLQGNVRAGVFTLESMYNI